MLRRREGRGILGRGRTGQGAHLRHLVGNRFATWIVVAAAGGGAVAWAVAAQLDAQAWVKASVAGLAAASGAAAAGIGRREQRLAARRARERTLHEHLRFWTLPRGRLCRLVDVDRRSLGLEAGGLADGVGVAIGDAYVPRVEDDAVCEALREQAFTLLVGRSKVGKTRSAYEAARAVCPDHHLVVPEYPTSLLAILTVDPPLDLGSALVWLDDLELRLGGEGGLTLNALSALNDREPPVRVLATMATSEFDAYRAASGVSKSAQLVLARAATIFLEPLTEIEGVRRALGPVPDSFVRTVSAHGLGATLAAGPDLVRRLQRGDGAAGAAIVRAAADWRRAGMSSPAPEDVLEQIFDSYLSSTQVVSRNAFRDGLDWALFEIQPGTALLARRSQPLGYLAADYVVDYTDDAGLEINEIVWQQALSRDSVDELLSVGLSAYARERIDIAEAAFRAAADAGSAEGAYNLAAVLEEEGRHEEASFVGASVPPRQAPGGTFDVLAWTLANGLAVVRLVGEVDLYTGPKFKQALLEAIDNGAVSIIVDLTDTTFIDSGALNVLVGAVKRLRANDGQLVVVCPDRNIRRIFEITGLDRVFPIYMTLDQATSSLTA
jgi:anti-anti-sigma factor